MANRAGRSWVRVGVSPGVLVSLLLALLISSVSEASAQAETGTIIIEKQTDLDGVTGEFRFEPEVGAPGVGHSVAGRFDLADNGSQSFTEIPPGTYNVFELDPGPAFRLTSITCDDQNSTRKSTGNLETMAATIRLEEGETVRCVFRNKDVRGTMIIEKQTDPDGVTTPFRFEAEVGGAEYGHSVAGRFDLEDNGSQSFTGIPPGTYNVFELDPGPAFRLTSITCDDQDSTRKSTGNLETLAATIRLEEGETVRCVFTNTESTSNPPPVGRGTITIEKQTDQQGASRSFEFQGLFGDPRNAAPTCENPDVPGPAGTISLSDDQTACRSLPPGVYPASEVDPGPNYRLSDIDCDDQDSTGDLETRTATIRLEAGENVRCVFENEDLRGRITIEKQTNQQGASRLFEFQGLFGNPRNAAPTCENPDVPGPAGTISLSDDQTACRSLPPGVYPASEVDPGPNYRLSDIDCDDQDSTGDLETRTATIRLEAGENVRCVYTNVEASGTIIVDKITNPTGDPQSFSFDASGGSYADFSLTDAATPNSQNLAAGSYLVNETVLSGWDLTSATCTSSIGDTETPVNIELDAGETVTCTFTNRKRGMARVIKSVNGAAPSGAQSFTFQLRQGATPIASGTTLESQTATAANGGVVNFTTKLVPGATYQLCEIVMPGWLTTLGTFVPGSFMPPDGVAPNPDVDNSILCVNFTVTAGETKAFAIDNTPPPGGRALTIGFWKNWASCSQSSGKQKPVLDQTLARAEPVGVQIGDLVLHAGDCVKAVRILNKSRIDNGKKMSSDPAFNLAAQLLAAKLNVLAEAGTCPAAVTAINAAQALLDAINFNGATHATMSTAHKNQANSLATTLDRYNNNLLC